MNGITEAEAAERICPMAMANPSLHPSIAHIERPTRIARLPLDHRGFPVPWFVAQVNGIPDHRIVDNRRLVPAIKQKLCWICGQPLGRYLAFLIGPMCVITRTIAEPPAHRECGEYAVQACPFLARPHAHRRAAALPDHKLPPGNMITRNPGVACLWITRDFKIFHQGGGILFKLGDPIELRWYAEGRDARPAEVHASVYSGLALLYADAEAEDRANHDERRTAEYALAQSVAAASGLFPS